MAPKGSDKPAQSGSAGTQHHKEPGAKKDGGVSELDDIMAKTSGKPKKAALANSKAQGEVAGAGSWANEKHDNGKSK